jgi:hypothetical protein
MPSAILEQAARYGAQLRWLEDQKRMEDWAAVRLAWSLFLDQIRHDHKLMKFAILSHYDEYYR